MQGARVQFPVRELRSDMPHGHKNQNIKKKEEEEEVILQQIQ